MSEKQDKVVDETMKEIIGLPNSVHPVIEKALKNYYRSVTMESSCWNAALRVMEAIAEAGFVIVKNCAAEIPVKKHEPPDVCPFCGDELPVLHLGICNRCVAE